jgi:phosphate transport system substrate-binding protein
MIPPQTVNRTAGLLLSLALLVPSPGLAQEITLTSTDHTFSATGRFVSFEDGVYVIGTSLGDIQVDAATVTCEGAACPVMAVEDPTPIEADVRFVGSDTVGDGLMPLLLTGFGAIHNAAVDTLPSPAGTLTLALTSDEGYGDPIGVFQVDSQTSSAAFPALLDKSAEFGMASRRIKREEARALSQAGAGSMIAVDQEHIIAVDSLVVIVNPANPVRAITMANLARIYRGEIRNWSELGGPDLPITALSRPDGSGTRSTFEKHIPGGSANGQDLPIEDTNISMANHVNSDPGAIGYVGYAFVQGAQPVSLISACGIETAADAFSAKTEEYPMERRLYLYTRQDHRTETGQQFLDYALSSAADGVVEKSGFISLGVERITQDRVRERVQRVMDSTSSVFELNLMREMLLEMYQWDRLSSTFRFASGSNSIDQKAARDMDRLIEYLQTRPEGTKVSMVGFTDSDGAFSANRSLSQRRAQQVLAEIQKRANGSLAHISFETMGFGELAPADCNSDSEGKRINRRVEVWIQ